MYVSLEVEIFVKQMLLIVAKNCTAKWQILPLKMKIIICKKFKIIIEKENKRVNKSHFPKKNRYSGNTVRYHSQ